MAMIKKILSALVTIALTVFMLAGITKVVERKESSFRYSSFFEASEDFDVLFFGTSHVYCGIQPMKLWNDYGIVSYNLAGPDNFLPTTYWIVKNALDYKTPKLIVLDCYNIRHELKTTTFGYDYVHTALDAVPLTANKVQAVFDLIEENDKKAEFLWDFILYHSRWQKLTEDDFTNQYNPYKGGKIFTGIHGIKENDSVISDQKLAENTVGTKYLEEIIKLCQANGIEVLLTYIPYSCDETGYIEANSIYDIAAKYDLNYIDFLRKDNILQYSIDFLDDHGHLNKSGGTKITAYIGEYIRNNYDIPDRKTDPSYSSWYEDYNEYLLQSISLIYSENYLSRYLMQLYDNDINSIIYLQNAKKMSKYPALTNLGVDSGKLTSEEPMVIVIDNDSDEPIRYLVVSDSIKTSFGEVSFDHTDNGYSIQIDKKTNLMIDAGSSVTTIPINRRTKEVSESSDFKWNGTTYYKIQ